MNNLCYNTYPHQYNSTIKFQQGLPPPPNQILQSYDHYQGMMPYMNLQIAGNSLEEQDQKYYLAQEYYLDEQGNMAFSNYYTDNNNSEINKMQNESLSKSYEDSKPQKKETNLTSNNSLIYFSSTKGLFICLPYFFGLLFGKL